MPRYEVLEDAVRDIRSLRGSDPATLQRFRDYISTIRAEIPKTDVPKSKKLDDLFNLLGVIDQHAATEGSAAMKEITPFLDHGLTDALRDAKVPGFSEA